MFTWSTTPMSGTRQESRNIERGRKRERERERIKEEGGNEGKKREGRGKQRKRESENVFWSEKPKVKKKRKKLISCIKGGKKNTATHQSKSTAQRENYTALARW